jgi:hypothetical protein
MNRSFVSIATTINPPSPQLKTLASLTSKSGGKTIVIGDKKTPEFWHETNISFFSLEAQLTGHPFTDFAKMLPINHYCRKNLGYLYGILEHPEWIYETDDDNLVSTEGLNPPSLSSKESDQDIYNQGWINIYNYTNILNRSELIGTVWPRGYPLELINDKYQKSDSHEKVDYIEIQVPIANGLVDGDPDVDAIFRLTRSLPLQFEKLKRDLIIRGGTWAPFNSQNTWWHKSVFPLLYLPVTTSFRVTDILRSYVAQSIIMKFNMGIRFFGPSAIQERNEHSLIGDFEQEIPLYLNSQKMMSEINSSIQTSNNLTQAQFMAYQRLEKLGFVERNELSLLNCWIESIAQF